MHIGGVLSCCRGAWACFELTFSLLALACQKTHIKLLLVYFFSQSQFCKIEGTNLEYTTVFLYIIDNSNRVIYKIIWSFRPILAKQNSF